MSRSTFPHLRFPTYSHDLQYQLKPREVQRASGPKKLAGFETLSAARAEDELRVRLLLAHSPAKEELRRRIQHGDNTLASSVCMRQFRRCLSGQYLPLITNTGAASAYTLIPPGWIFPAGRLDEADPRRLLDTFRSQLNRCGLAALDGWMTTFLHGEYVMATDAYHLHVHILVGGGKSSALEAWRRLHPPREDARRPTARSVLRDIPRQVSYYAFQPYWPMKLVAHGARQARGARRRLPANQLVEWLTWMDQQRVSDLLWLHGCEIKSGRIMGK